jgi:subtilisin family serine protease
MRGLAAVLSILAVLGFPGSVSASHGSAPTSRPGEILVSFAGSSTRAERADALSDLDATVLERLPLPGLVRVRLDPGTDVSAAVAALEKRPYVRYAQPNNRYSLFATPNDPSYSLEWGLGQIRAPAAWDVSTGSDAVTVAVVDSGVQYTHPDISANVWTNPGETTDGLDNDGNGLIDDVRGWDFYAEDAVPLDEAGHGTHVAGTIGARGNNAVGVTGVNWRVKLMALRAGATTLSDADIVESFRYACAKGAKVINGSFGSSQPSPSISQAIASCPGSLFVFAAGNNGTNDDLQPAYPCADQALNVVCVAASNQSDAPASFSNYGPTSVDLAAPGQDVYSTALGSAYAYMSGTSMATPHVAGAAALVWAVRPALTVAEVKRALLASVDQSASLADRVATGGRLDVARALTQDVQAPTGLTASAASPAPGVWTNNSSVAVKWNVPSDPSGVDGYSFAFSQDAGFIPDEVKDAEEAVTSVTRSLPDGANWFHLRARDNAGNWSDAVHVGPLLIDTFAPVRPRLSSPTHRPRVASATRRIVIEWAGATDSGSGVDGFSFAWARGRSPAVDLTKDAEETVVRSATRLAPGRWWFGVRARDNAGNWSGAVTVGPFVITRVVPVCTVPRLRGLRIVQAKRLLIKRGCALGRVTRAYSARVGRGRVIAQRRTPGLRLRRGAKVGVTLSRGPHRR